MLSFLSRQSPRAFDNEFADFKNSFSTEQKAAILGCHYLIAAADSGINIQEEKYIESIAKRLEIQLSDSIFSQAPQKGKQHMIATLASLDKSQKEWFISAVFGLILCDRPTNAMESKCFIGIAVQIGISENEVVQVISKSQALTKTIQG